MTLTLLELANKLVDVCKEQDLEYDPRVLPIKLTADCYIIYATPMSHDCRRDGKCSVNQYYALTGGDTIIITER